MIDIQTPSGSENGFREDAAAFKGIADQTPTKARPGGLTSEQKAEAFQQLYSQWLAFRAEFAAGIEDEKKWNERQDEFEAHELRFLFTPAPLRWMIWWKFEVLELALNAEGRGDLCDDTRPLRAIAAIKSDLLRFGFDL